jgi:hypothetical protein
MKQAATALLALFLTIGVAQAFAQGRLSDDEVRARIIRASLASYPGNCPCPYNTDRAGRACGGRSAWSRQGGYAPICYPKEVSDEQVREWRARN